MSEWRSIEEWDSSTKEEKSRPAVFFFKADRAGQLKLDHCVQTSRTYGFRVCTHFMWLPGYPKC